MKEISEGETPLNTELPKKGRRPKDESRPEFLPDFPIPTVKLPGMAVKASTSDLLSDYRQYLQRFAPKSHTVEPGEVLDAVLPALLRDKGFVEFRKALRSDGLRSSDGEADPKVTE